MNNKLSAAANRVKLGVRNKANQVKLAVENKALDRTLKRTESRFPEPNGPFFLTRRDCIAEMELVRAQLASDMPGRLEFERAQINKAAEAYTSQSESLKKDLAQQRLEGAKTERARHLERVARLSEVLEQIESPPITAAERLALEMKLKQLRVQLYHADEPWLAFQVGWAIEQIQTPSALEKAWQLTSVRVATAAAVAGALGYALYPMEFWRPDSGLFSPEVYRLELLAKTRPLSKAEADLLVVCRDLSLESCAEAREDTSKRVALAEKARAKPSRLSYGQWLGRVFAKAIHRQGPVEDSR